MSGPAYRPEIDGLRALAVVPVIFYHGGMPGFGGGFIGVDVFFVISGFLITQIILRERAAGHFTFRSFYERRARRLMPALFLVIVASLPFAFVWMTPGQLKAFGQSIGYTVLFVANIGLESETGYFADRADLYPFLHTWSLSVEEQFYLFFPAFLLLLLRVNPYFRWIAIGALFAGSLGLSEWRSVAAPGENFYYLTTRAWELLAGCALAMATDGRATSRRIGDVASVAGLALLLAGFAVFDHSTPHPSLWTLLPVLGTALILFGAHGTAPVARALA